MNGHFKINSQEIKKIIWEDSTIEKIKIDYNSFTFTIEEPNGNKKQLFCKGYIGYLLNGYWDEVIVKNAELKEKHEYINIYIERIKKKYGGKLPYCGSIERNKKEYSILIINFIDGLELFVVANDFIVSSDL